MLYVAGIVFLCTVSLCTIMFLLAKAQNAGKIRFYAVKQEEGEVLLPPNFTQACHRVCMILLQRLDAIQPL